MEKGKHRDCLHSYIESLIAELLSNDNLRNPSNQHPSAMDESIANELTSQKLVWNTLTDKYSSGPILYLSLFRWTIHILITLQCGKSIMPTLNIISRRLWREIYPIRLSLLEQASTQM